MTMNNQSEIESNKEIIANLKLEAENPTQHENLKKLSSEMKENISMNEKNKSLKNEEKWKPEEIKEFWKSRGHNNHKERMSWMTGTNSQIIYEFQKINTWDKLHEWHQKNTPWLGKEEINLLMKSYHREALENNEKNKLNPNQEWMIHFSL